MRPFPAGTVTARQLAITFDFPSFAPIAGIGDARAHIGNALVVHDADDDDDKSGISEVRMGGWILWSALENGGRTVRLSTNTVMLKFV
jgi:hypothetical protein